MINDEYILQNEKNLEMNLLKKSEISEMHDNGMIIGSHTENHPVMSRLIIKIKNMKFKVHLNVLNRF